MEGNWHIVYTKKRWEKKVAALLTKKKIENYCPLHLAVHPVSDSKKSVFEPLFASYVFVYISENQYPEIKQVPGVINLVLWVNKPAIVQDKDIQVIREFIAVYKSIRLERAAVNINDTAHVLSGPFMNNKGNLVPVVDNSSTVILPSLGYCMFALVQKSNVDVMRNYDITLPNNLSYQLSINNPS